MNMNINPRRLERYIIFSAGFGVLFVGVVVALSVIIPLRNQLQENIQQELKHDVETRVLVLEQYLTRTRDIALQIGSRTKARDALESYNNHFTSQSDFVEFSVPILQDAMSRSDDCIGIMRFDIHNNLAAAIGKTVEQELWEFPKDNSGAIISGLVNIKDQSLLIIASPILDSANKQMGTDMVIFDASNLINIVSIENKSYDSQQLFLVADRGNKFQAIAASHHHGIISGTENILNEKILSALSIVEYSNSGLLPRSVSYATGSLVAYAPVSGIPWILVLVQDISVVDASIFEQLLHVGLVIIIFIGIGIYGTWLMIHPLTRQLIEDKVFLDVVLENIEEGVVACNEKGILSLFNKATAEFYGSTLQPLSPEKWTDDYELHDASDTTSLLLEENPLYRALQGETVRDFEMIIAHREKQNRVVIVNARTMYDENNVKVGAVLTMRDVTEAKKIESLRIARDSAEAANKAKSQFLANMSHELRTPLNAIIGYSQMLVEETVDSNQGQSQLIIDLRKIESSGKHLLELINDILDLSKIEAGKMDIVAEQISIRTLSDEVINTMQAQMEKNNNVFKTDYPDVDIVMFSDSQKIKQILFNLLGNAAKFTSNGIITLTLRSIEGTDIQPAVKFVISDTGIGMNADQLDVIFNAFTQTRNTTAREYGGTGLGLSITDQFCKILGGNIQVDSEPGKGTIFTVILPLKIDPPISKIEPETTI